MQKKRERGWRGAVVRKVHVNVMEPQQQHKPSSCGRRRGGRRGGEVGDPWAMWLVARTPLCGALCGAALRAWPP